MPPMVGFDDEMNVWVTSPDSPLLIQTQTALKIQDVRDFFSNYLGVENYPQSGAFFYNCDMTSACLPGAFDQGGAYNYGVRPSYIPDPSYYEYYWGLFEEQRHFIDLSESDIPRHDNPSISAPNDVYYEIPPRTVRAQSQISQLQYPIDEYSITGFTAIGLFPCPDFNLVKRSSFGFVYYNLEFRHSAIEYCYDNFTKPYTVQTNDNLDPLYWLFLDYNEKNIEYRTSQFGIKVNDFVSTWKQKITCYVLLRPADKNRAIYYNDYDYGTAFGASQETRWNDEDDTLDPGTYDTETGFLGKNAPTEKQYRLAIESIIGEEDVDHIVVPEGGLVVEPGFTHYGFLMVIERTDLKNDLDYSLGQYYSIQRPPLYLGDPDLLGDILYPRTTLNSHRPYETWNFNFDLEFLSHRSNPDNWLLSKRLEQGGIGDPYEEQYNDV
jgi:hypothetical protein